MSDDYLWDRKGAPDPDVARLEQLLAPLAHDAPLRKSRRTWWIVGAAVAAAAAVAIVLALPRGPESSGFDFVARDGTVLVNAQTTSSGTLATGDVLDTRTAHVDLKIADIGRAELSPDTQVRLERSDKTRRQLSIDRGRMHARVVAPPRLFVVSTRAASVTDLGCEYTIEVGADGSGHLEVQSGHVELATKNGASVIAPAGTHARILASQPGLPMIDGASPEIERAVDDYLAGKGPNAILAAATEDDAITVVNLAIVDPAARRAAADRLAELVPLLDAPGDELQRLMRWRAELVVQRRHTKSKKAP
jgi:ferric-dicitrate binding protein FerR (iron transport regulator)